jgi:hypothetical protein
MDKRTLWQIAFAMPPASPPPARYRCVDRQSFIIRILANTLSAGAHTVMAASPSTGVDTVIPASNSLAGQTRFAGWLRVLFLSAPLALLAPAVAAQDTIAPGAKVSVVFDHELPNVPGKSMRAVLVEYAPGAGSPHIVTRLQPSSMRAYSRERYAAK